MPDPLYAIDDAELNTRPDWKIKVIEGAMTSKRYESFPGDPNLYAVNGQVQGPVIIVGGYLEADTFGDLYDLVRTESLRREAIMPPKVTVEGVDFEECDLRQFRTVGDYTPMTRGAFDGLAVMVLYIWQQLISEGA